MSASTETNHKAILEGTKGQAVLLQKIDIQASVDGLLFTVKARQFYKNTTKKNIETIYTFPLAWGCTLLGLTATMAGKTWQGTVLPKSEAEENYEKAIKEGDTVRRTARIMDVPVGDAVIGGTLNQTGGFLMVADKVGQDTMLARIIGMVAEAQGGAAGPVKGLFGAHMVTVRWESFSFLPGFAMGTAAGALAGQYLGAGSVALARRAIWACLWVGMAMMGVLGIVFMVAGEPLARLMSRDPVIVAEVPRTLFICGIVQVFFAMGLVIRQGLKGCGDAKGTLVITLVSTVLVRVPLAYVCGIVLGWGLAGIWIGLCVELGVRGLLFLGRFVRGGWERARV